MGKRKRMVSGIRYTYDEIRTDRMIGKENKNVEKNYDDNSFDFDMDCLTYLPLKNPLICPFGYSFSRDSASKYLQNHSTHPFVPDQPFSMDILRAPKFTQNSAGQKIDVIDDKILTAKHKIVMIGVTGNVFSFNSVREFNLKPKMMNDLITGEAFTENDIIVIHDPDRERDLPDEPIINTKIEVEDSELVKNAAKFVSSLLMTKEQALKIENLWYLARPTPESLKQASFFKRNPPKKRPHAIIKTSLGEIIVELDVDVSTLACINFIGYAFRNVYNNVKVEKVVSSEYFIVCPHLEVDESVWTYPIAYERDEVRRNFKYVIYFLNTGNKQLHITNTGKFGITCQPMNLDDFHVFGGVISGEGIVSSICNGKILPDGRPAKPFSIKSISIVNNPFPASPP
ncbi:hypothetical protein TRFO_35186 [Tritrichomonas foetus]|uniref:PPIase cyclophilin-type domain-containing protein n=1 Tax=Tritrichomonas foetus TaxID=1144522 RepID=A0A1J4JLH2_9EUKA|nr:hypothetical protein TRFO_35186 [Tritrichomonas foetus]|eukprot:OHS98411.1 hypothetical protein TRFO_35186 [Tritrichomonas foetus]